MGAFENEDDLRQWLKEGGLSPTEIEDQMPVWRGRLPYLKQSHLRQADYSRFVNDYKAKQEQLAADYKKKDDDLTQQMADWASVQATTAEEQKQIRNALDALEQEKLRLTQIVTRQAQEAGVDPKTVLDGGHIAPPKKEEPPAAFDPAPVYGAMGGIADFMLSLMGKMPQMANEHFKLTGEPLDTDRLVSEIKARAAKKEPIDPVALWEQLYEIPAKRTAATQKAEEERLKAAEQRGYERARSESAIPGQQSPGIHAPVFRGERTSALQRPQPGGNTARFASSLASGKYRQAPPAPNPGAGAA